MNNKKITMQDTSESKNLRPSALVLSNTIGNSVTVLTVVFLLCSLGSCGSAGLQIRGKELIPSAEVTVISGTVQFDASKSVSLSETMDGVEYEWTFWIDGESENCSPVLAFQTAGRIVGDPVSIRCKDGTKLIATGHIEQPVVTLSDANSPRRFESIKGCLRLKDQDGNISSKPIAEGACRTASLENAFDRPLAINISERDASSVRFDGRQSLPSAANVGSDSSDLLYRWEFFIDGHGPLYVDGDGPANYLPYGQPLETDQLKDKKGQNFFLSGNIENPMLTAPTKYSGEVTGCLFVLDTSTKKSNAIGACEAIEFEPAQSNSTPTAKLSSNLSACEQELSALFDSSKWSDTGMLSERLITYTVENKDSDASVTFGGNYGSAVEEIGLAGTYDKFSIRNLDDFFVSIGLVLPQQLDRICVSSEIVNDLGEVSSEPSDAHCFLYKAVECFGNIGNNIIGSPSKAVEMDVFLWGAGGGAQDTNYNVPGSAGGYAEAKFLVASGDVFNAFVGEGGQSEGTVSLGFGGSSQNYDGSGGGLSGLFLGSGPVVDDFSTRNRALAVAGGGAGGGYVGNGFSANLLGGAGCSEQSGGNASFQGSNGNTLAGNTDYGIGSGGGWFGGNASSPLENGSSNGGSCYINPAALSGSISFESNFSNTPPEGNACYQEGVGQGGVPTSGLTNGKAGDGMVCVQWRR